MDKRVGKQMGVGIFLAVLCAACGSSASTSGSATGSGTGSGKAASATDEPGGGSSGTDSASPVTPGGTGGTDLASDDASAAAGDAEAADASEGADVMEGTDGGAADAAGSDAQDLPAAGKLTAGDWNDNLNFSWFVGYLQDMAQQYPGWATLPMATRVLVHVVTQTEQPVGNAHIRLLENGGEVASTYAGTDGRGVVLPVVATAQRVVEVQVSIHSTGDQLVPDYRVHAAVTARF